MPFTTLISGCFMSRAGLGRRYALSVEFRNGTLLCCHMDRPGKQLCCIWTGLGNNFVAYGQAWETTLLHMDRPGKQFCCVWTGLGKQLCSVWTGLGKQLVAYGQAWETTLLHTDRLVHTQQSCFSCLQFLFLLHSSVSFAIVLS